MSHDYIKNIILHFNKARIGRITISYENIIISLILIKSSNNNI